jgi:hypothetical protein
VSGDEPPCWWWQVVNDDGTTRPQAYRDWLGKSPETIAGELVGMLLLRTPESRWSEMGGWAVRLWRPDGPEVVVSVPGWLAAARREAEPAA